MISSSLVPKHVDGYSFGVSPRICDRVFCQLPQCQFSAGNLLMTTCCNPCPTTLAPLCLAASSMLAFNLLGIGEMCKRVPPLKIPPGGKKRQLPQLLFERLARLISPIMPQRGRKSAGKYEQKVFPGIKTLGLILRNHFRCGNRHRGPHQPVQHAATFAGRPAEAHRLQEGLDHVPLQEL